MTFVSELVGSALNIVDKISIDNFQKRMAFIDILCVHYYMQTTID